MLTTTQAIEQQIDKLKAEKQMLYTRLSIIDNKIADLTIKKLNSKTTKSKNNG